MTTACALLAFIIFQSLGENFWPEKITVFDYYGWFAAAMIVSGTIFHRIVLAEARTKRSRTFWSTIILRTGWALFYASLAVCLLNLFPFFSAWLGGNYPTLDVIIGWPLFISAVVLFILIFVGWFIRDQSVYGPEYHEVPRD